MSTSGRWCAIPARAALPAGVERVGGDLELPESLTPALDGARAVFLLGGWSDMPELLRRIERAGVERVVLLTSRCVVGGRADNPVTRMWMDSEAAVRGSGVPWTVLRPSGYQSNALRWLPQLRTGDVVRAPWPEVAIAAIDPADIAAVAATRPDGARARRHGVLAERPRAADRPASRSRRWARRSAARCATSRSPTSEARAAMAADTPAPYVDAFFRFYSDGEFDDAGVVETVERLAGRPPRRFAQWARAHADAFR